MVLRVETQEVALHTAEGVVAVAHLHLLLQEAAIPVEAVVVHPVHHSALVAVEVVPVHPVVALAAVVAVAVAEVEDNSALSETKRKLDKQKLT